MEMRTLGRTGMQVSKFCLGAGMFGYFGNSDHDDCIKVTHAALDGGINYIDVSDVYSHGEAEEIVGKALKGRRDDVIVATKFGLPMKQEPNYQGGSRRWIMRAVDDSLRRLDTDYIDLYQMHRPDLNTPLDETLAALTDLVRAGKIRAFGCSTFPPEMMVEAAWVAEARGHYKFQTDQPPYSLFARGIEGHALPTAQKLGMGVVVWSPLAQGWLSGKWRKGATPNDTNRQNLQPHLFDMSRPDNQRKLDIVEQLAQLAEANGMSLLHMAHAFVCAHPAVTSAIIGPRTMAHLTGALDGADVVLADDILDAIDGIVPPGENISTDDAGYVPPSLANAQLRRRQAAAGPSGPDRKTLENIERYRQEKGR